MRSSSATRRRRSRPGAPTPSRARSRRCRTRCACPSAVRRRADAGRPPRLRPADRRRAGDRGHRHPLRRRRRHRLPHEALGARPAGVADRRRSRSVLERALLRETAFGIGATLRAAADHDVLDADRWAGTPLAARRCAQKAAGAARHSRLRQPLRRVRHALAARRPTSACRPGEYLALLSHSGCRGAGAQIADHYSKLARDAAPRAAEGALVPGLARSRLRARARSTGHAMNLMGDYAAANHERDPRAPRQRALGPACSRASRTTTTSPGPSGTADAS